MITLGIETSCDETALCLLETHKKDDGNEGAGKNILEYRIIGNIVHSQINLHREYGGVFPMLAKREHIKNLPILYKKIIKESGISEKQINNIAVTQGPGLEPALWTGILFAKELGKKLNIPVIPINHMEGHIVSSLLSHSNPHNEFQELKQIEFPALALLISGGHTEIIKVKKISEYEKLGATVDDAIGEAFDKVARMLELPYPGGPEISRLAEKARKEKKSNVEGKKGNLENKKEDKNKINIKLPRPMLHSKNLNFSFAGLKTAVLYLLKEMGNTSQEQKEEIAREFEDAVTEVLISKTKTAINENETKSLIIGGGVIANIHIRKAFEKLAEKNSIALYLPISELTGDNALMIALVGAMRSIGISGSTIKPSEEGFIALGNLSL